MLVSGCGEPRSTPIARTTLDSESARTDGGRLDTATAAFLSLFEAAADTVRLRGATTLRLWDRLLVAEAPGFDPLREINIAATRWEQIEGPPVPLDAPASLDAAVRISAVSATTRYLFRLTMRNTSGERSLRLPVLVKP